MRPSPLSILLVPLLLLIGAGMLRADGVGASAWISYAPGQGTPHVIGYGLAEPGVAKLGAGRYRVFLARAGADTAFAAIVSPSDLNMIASCRIESPGRVIVEARDINTHQLRDGAFTLAIFDHFFPGSGVGAYGWLFYVPEIVVARSDSGLAGAGVTYLGTGRYRVTLARRRAGTDYAVMLGSCTPSMRAIAQIESADQVLVEVRDAVTDRLEDGAFTFAVIDTSYRDGIRVGGWGRYAPAPEDPMRGSTAGYRLAAVDRPITRISAGRYRVTLDHAAPQNIGLIASAGELSRYASATIEAADRVIVETRNSETGQLEDAPFSLVLFEPGEARAAVGDDPPRSIPPRSTPSGSAPPGISGGPSLSLLPALDASGAECAGHPFTDATRHLPEPATRAGE